MFIQTRGDSNVLPMPFLRTASTASELKATLLRKRHKRSVSRGGEAVGGVGRRG